jgi:hypothetical protein
MFGYLAYLGIKSSLWAYTISISKTTLPTVFLNFHSTKQIFSIYAHYILLQHFQQLMK